MRPPYPAGKGLLALLLAAALGSQARADLAASSPFLPANAQAPGASGGPSGPIELRGIMPIPDGGSAYLIYDVEKKKSAWVGLSEGGHAFMVKSADPKGDSVTVDYQGRVLKLTLHTAKVASVGAAAAGPATAISSTVVVNPSPADEQRRLDAVAQEVRRRRMERERAAQNVPGQGPGGLPLPMPAPNR
ncbi:MAG: hypothetical protein WAN79_06305 [Opitutaceae bacterium]